MSSQTNNFLTLIPAAHRVAIISPFTSSIDSVASDESVIPVLPKTHRSSSTATSDSSSTAEEPSLPSETVEPIVEPITEDTNVPIDIEQPETPVTHRFLRLGN